MRFRARPLGDPWIFHKLPHLAKPRSANAEPLSGTSHISPHHGRSVITGWKPKVTGQHGHPIKCGTPYGHSASRIRDTAFVQARGGSFFKK